MVESYRESRIEGGTWCGGAEVKTMIGLVYIIEDVVNACFHIEGERLLLAPIGTKGIVAGKSPELIALAVAVQLVVAFGRGASVYACT